MSRRIRTALIGCGKVGHTHALAFRNLPQSEFVAVCSRSLDKAQRYGQQYGVLAFDDCVRMFAEAGVEAVAICTPHPSHAELVELAARRGAHVFVEKPLAADLADCDRAISACRQAGVKLGVISQRRFYPPVQRMRQAIEAGKIGRPILATLTVLGWRDAAYYRSDPWRGSWQREGGGVLVNQTPHQLDLLQWLMGPVEELSGYWDNFNHPTIEVEDTAIAVIRFKSGALGSLVLSNSVNPGLYGNIHIHGANGAAIGSQTEGGSMFISGVTSHVDPPINDLWTVPGEAHLLESWQAEDRRSASQVDVMTYYHELQIADFLDAILENREPLVTGEDGRRTVELFTAIYRSQRDRRPVQFPLAAEQGRDDFDGRLGYVPLSRRGKS